MKTLGNIIWVIFGGFFLFIHYIISGILMCLTIIGIPFGIQIFKMSYIALWPFGKEIINIDSGTGCLSMIMNLLWIILGGIWLALHHFLWGILFSITIIGIPFGLQHFKLARVALLPFGKSIR
jgi:uncharacterized membrane protein YccF (DUF307 family)